MFSLPDLEMALEQKNPNENHEGYTIPVDICRHQDLNFNSSTQDKLR
jgi:hypothetical protein